MGGGGAIASLPYPQEKDRAMAKMLDFHEVRGAWYKFRFQTTDSDDFRGALAGLKEISLDQRNWIEKERSWEVLKTLANEQKLAAIFDNGRTCIEALKSQLRMF